MRLFYDTEFTGLTKDTSLISIGIISETGVTFYAEVINYNQSQVSNWIKHNVIEHLVLRPDVRPIVSALELPEDIGRMMANTTLVCCCKEQLGAEILKWTEENFPGQTCHWVSDCLAYDWVLLCDLYGGAMSIPRSYYYIPRDICPMFEDRGIDPDVNREEFAGLFGGGWLTLPLKRMTHEVGYTDREGNKHKYPFIKTFFRPIKHNALSDAIVIRECYNRLKTPPPRRGINQAIQHFLHSHFKNQTI